MRVEILVREAVEVTFDVDARSRVSVVVPDPAHFGRTLERDDPQPFLGQLVNGVDPARTSTDHDSVIIHRIVMISLSSNIMHEVDSPCVVCRHRGLLTGVLSGYRRPWAALVRQSTPIAR